MGDFNFGIFVVVVLLILIILIAICNIKVVPQAYAYVIERLGAGKTPRIMVYNKCDKYIGELPHGENIVEFVQLSSALVYLLHLFYKLFVGQVFVFGGAVAASLYARLFVRIYENSDGGEVLEYGIGASAYNHAVALFAYRLNYLLLGDEYVGYGARRRRNQGNAPAEGEHIVPVSAVFKHFGHIVLVQLGALCNLSHELLVVVFQPERVGKAFADLSAAASELSAYRKSHFAEYGGMPVDGSVEVGGGERRAQRQVCRRLVELYAAHYVDVYVLGRKVHSAPLF